MLFISNEEMNNITKPVESLENLGLLIAGITETVKHGIKIQEGGILVIDSNYGCLIDPTVVSSIINAIPGKEKQESRKITRVWISSIIRITFNDEKSGKGATRAEKGYNNLVHVDKNVLLRSIL